MVFINSSQVLGVILTTGSTYTTGSVFLSLFLLLLVFIAIAMLFGIRLDYTLILLLPLLLSYMAFYSEFLAVGSVILIYLAMIFSQKFFIK